MYLEVYVFNSTSVKEEQVHDEEGLPGFPPNEVLKRIIEAKVAKIRWKDKETGRVENVDFQGQIILGHVNSDKVIFFRITGGSDPFKLIIELSKENGWTSYTPENSHFLEFDMDTKKYWEDYKKYRGWVNQTFYQNDRSNFD